MRQNVFFSNLVMLSAHSGIYKEIICGLWCGRNWLAFKKSPLEKARTGLALHGVFLQVNRLVISNKQQPDTTNELILQYELLTVKNMNL